MDEFDDLPQKSDCWESWLAFVLSIASDDDESDWQDWEEILKDDEAGAVASISDLEPDV